MTDKAKSGQAEAQLHALARKQLATENMHPDAADPVRLCVQRANVQVGLRDLILLTISSLFALLLVFVAPLVRHLQTQGGGVAKPAAQRASDSES